MASTVGSSGARFEVAAPSQEALLQKALLECESAARFFRKVKNIGLRVAVLVTPNVLGPTTGRYIDAGAEFFVIARCHRLQDGRVYLRLNEADGGWVCVRSRKDFWKVVLASVSGGALEPAGCPEVLESRAAALLPRIDSEGRRVDSEGRISESSDALEPWTFRISAGRPHPVLSYPSLADSSSSTGTVLNAQEEVKVDAVTIVPEEGRVYLRLEDGEGWISECRSSDFYRTAVEPLHLVEDSNARRKGQTILGQDVKAIVLERKDQIASPKHKSKRLPSPDPDPAVFRSDFDLWPKACGAPRPITPVVRKALHKLEKSYGRKLKECSADLKDVNARIRSYSVDCKGKEQLEKHSKTLSDEISKIEYRWTYLVEKEAGRVPDPPVKSQRNGDRQGAIAPVQVLGERWHCATVAEYLGPLRSDATAAASDLHHMSQLLGFKNKNGSEEDGSQSSKNGVRAETSENKSLSSQNVSQAEAEEDHPDTKKRRVEINAGDAD